MSKRRHVHTRAIAHHNVNRDQSLSTSVCRHFALILLLKLAEFAPASVLIRVVVRCFALVILNPKTKPIHVALQGSDTFRWCVEGMIAQRVEIQLDCLVLSVKSCKEFKGIVWAVR